MIEYLIQMIYLTLWIFRRRERFKFALYIRSRYALDWWELIQFHRIRQDKDKIHSWTKMKKMLAIDFSPLDYDVILSYTKQDY